MDLAREQYRQQNHGRRDRCAAQPRLWLSPRDWAERDACWKRGNEKPRGWL